MSEQDSTRSAHDVNTIDYGEGLTETLRVVDAGDRGVVVGRIYDDNDMETSAVTVFEDEIGDLIAALEDLK